MNRCIIGRTVSVKVFALVFSLIFSLQAMADVKLPTVLADKMVLQRDQSINIWGWADAGEKVSVTLAGKTVEATADADGNWIVELSSQKANKVGQEITIKGKNEIVLKDVLFGDVWIGSGQSNMEWGLGGTDGGKEAIAASENSNLRLYHVPKRKSGEPQKDIQANWKECSSKTTGGFSAVLYYFGRMVNAETDVPMGLINSSWGGSPIEPWLVKGGMYNSMIAPLHNFKIKGFLWYQGESNINIGLEYFDKKKVLIEGWREKWGNAELPFYFVQLAPFAGYKDGVQPVLWEAQCKTLTLPRTGMAVTTDIVHNIRDIHPRNKKDVGERLARWALVKDYRKKMVYSGPLYKKLKIKKEKIYLYFEHVGGGLVSRDGKDLSEFEIAGEDGKYVPATATIKGKKVIVQAEEVKEPRNVRFGWSKMANPNLMNEEKLPASPFQTDNWQGGTGE